MIGRMPGKHGMPDKYDYSAPIGLALYDLENDLSELNDLSERYPEVVERLSRMADAMRDDLGDSLTGVARTCSRDTGSIG